MGSSGRTKEWMKVKRGPEIGLDSAPAHIIPIDPAASSVPRTPRFRALALFGRRLAERPECRYCRRPKTCTITDSAPLTCALALPRRRPVAGCPWGEERAGRLQFAELRRQSELTIHSVNSPRRQFMPASSPPFPAGPAGLGGFGIILRRPTPKHRPPVSDVGHRAPSCFLVITSVGR